METNYHTLFTEQRRQQLKQPKKKNQSAHENLCKSSCQIILFLTFTQGVNESEIDSHIVII